MTHMVVTSDLTSAEKDLQTPVLAEESTKPVWGPDLIDQVIAFILVPFVLLKVPRSTNLWSRGHCDLIGIGEEPSKIRQCPLDHKFVDLGTFSKTNGTKMNAITWSIKSGPQTGLVLSSASTGV